jgi:hypothetical protein
MQRIWNMTYLVLVATETFNVKLDPLQRGELILDAQVNSAAGASLLALREAQWSETVVEIDENNRCSL